MKIHIRGLAVAVSLPFSALVALLLIIDKTGYMIHSLTAIILHEAGHLMAMKITRRMPKEVDLRLGGFIIVGGPTRSDKENAIIMLAGPLSNIAAAALLFAAGQATTYSHITVAAVTQGTVGIFNLLPIRGLDGGTVLYSILSMTLRTDRARLLSQIISVIFTMAVIIVGVTVLFISRSNPTLLILGIYLLMLNIPRFGLGEPFP